MTHPLRKFIGDIVRSGLAKRQRAIVRVDKFTGGMTFVHHTLRRLGIDCVLDVGANVGQTGLEFRAAGYQGRIISFEPQAGAFRELQQAAKNDPLWECHQLALGDTDDHAKMEVSGMSMSSSLLKLDDKHLEAWPDSAPVGVEDIRVATLDSLAGTLGLSGRKILLKMDVQGYESTVLRGAARTLPDITAAYAELLFCPLYKGQSKYHEVMGTLESAGLRFAGLYEAEPDSVLGYPLFANGLFVREPHQS